MAANAEMIRMYWDIGRMVVRCQGIEGWGRGILARLAKDLKNELPEVKGFSERNLRRMIQFYREYLTLFLIWPRPVAKLEETQNRPRAVAILACPS